MAARRVKNVDKKDKREAASPLVRSREWA